MNKLYRIIVKGSDDDSLDWVGSNWSDSPTQLIQEWEKLSNAGYFCKLQTIVREY